MKLYDRVKIVKPIVGPQSSFMGKIGTIVADLGSSWYDVRLDGIVEPLPCVARELERV